MCGFAVTGETDGSTLTSMLKRFGDGSMCTCTLALPRREAAWVEERSSAISLLPRWTFRSWLGAVVLRRTTVATFGFAPQKRGFACSTICWSLLKERMVYGPLPCELLFRNCSA